MSRNLEYGAPVAGTVHADDGVTTGALGVPPSNRSAVQRDVAQSYVSRHVAAASATQPSFSHSTAEIASHEQVHQGSRQDDEVGVALLAEQPSSLSLRGWLHRKAVAYGVWIATLGRNALGLPGEWVDRVESRYRSFVDRVLGSPSAKEVRSDDVASTPKQSLSSRCAHALGALGGAVASLFGRADLSRSSPPTEPPKYGRVHELPVGVRDALASTNTLFEQQELLGLQRQKGEQVLSTLRQNLNAVSVEEFLRLEDGKRLGSSGKNILHVPEGMAANFDLSRLSETGVVVFVNGISLTGQEGVRGYVRTIAAYYGRPVLVVVNDENGLFRTVGDPRGEGRPNKVASVVNSAVASALGHMDARLGEQVEPSVSMLSRAYEEVLAAGLKNNVSLAHSQGCNITSMGVLKVKRENPELFERFKRDFEVEGVAPVECRYPPDVRVRLWGSRGDPLMKLGGVLDTMMEPFHSERVSRSGEIVRFPGDSHDFDECVPRNLSTVVVGEALSRGATGERGKDFALEVIESVANARYGDAVFDQIFTAMATQQNDPKLAPFARAFSDTVKRFCPEGRIGRYVVPSGNEGLSPFDLR